VIAGLVYLDASAIVKLAMPEPESSALFAWLIEHPDHVTSALARVEVRRALRRAGVAPAVLRRAVSVLETIAAVPIDRGVIEAAGELEPPDLRSLDTIHLATALSIGADLAGMVTYDDRLSAAAARVGVQVWTPGV
jgi:predicted nucleic acid-binding protein